MVCQDPGDRIGADDSRVFMGPDGAGHYFCRRRDPAVSIPRAVNLDIFSQAKPK